MRKTFKSFLSIVLTLTMVFSYVPVAFATDTQDTADSTGVSTPEETQDASAVSETGTDGEGGTEPPVYVAQNGSVQYTSLADAIEKAQSGDTITLLADVASIPVIDKPLTIDGNQKSVTDKRGEHQFGKIEGTVTLINIVFANGTEAIRTDYGNYGAATDDYEKLNLVIEECTFNGVTNYAIMGGSDTKKLGSLTVKSCTFNAAEGATAVDNYFVWAQQVGTLNVEKCTFNGNGVTKGAIHTGEPTSVATNATITDNKINGVARGIQIGNRVANSTVTVSGNTFSKINTNSTSSDKTGAVYIHSNATAAATVTVNNNTATDTTNFLFNNGNDDIGEIVTAFVGNSKNGESIYMDANGADTTTAPTPVGPTTIDLSQGSYTIETAGEYVVSTYTGANTLTIKANATVELKGVNITAAEGVSAISIESGNVILNVTADSTLTGGKGGAGVYVAETASVTIKGGKLTAIGNGGADTDDSGAAGIGGTWANGQSGKITIEDATVVAYGYGKHGSGIGSGSGKVVGEIKINNANVTAQGGWYADGAGANLTDDWGKGDKEGGAAIGGGGKTASTIAAITIENSTVTAYGGAKAAGIGANFWCSVSNITISNSTIIAYGGASSAGIGTSRDGDNGVSATITITGGKITATGGDYGAGIGSGYNNKSLGNDQATPTLPQTTIAINGAEVTATGGMGGAGIGGGYKGNNSDIRITNSKITAAAGELVRNKTVATGGSACGIGSGANGSGTFAAGPEVKFDAATEITVTAYSGGKAAIEGMTDEEINAADNITFIPVVTGLSGSGTETDPYLINNLYELIWFRDDVNTYTSEGTNQYYGKYVKLNADIDLAGINWTPIGTNSVGDHMAFMGIFDGGNHTISNLKITDGGDHLGFFARTGSYDETKSATVKNITFNNIDIFAKVTNHWTTGHGDYVGGVIANAGGNTIVDNVKVTGDVYVVGCGYVGGIVGHGYPDMTNCYVTANDGSYVHAGYWCAGGIIGYAGEGGTPITNCSVSGLDVWSAYGAAAAVAGLYNAGNTITNVSVTNVDVTSSSDSCMGYVAGNGEESTMTNVTVTNVTATANGKAITVTDAVASIGDAIYFDLQSAINAAVDGNTIVLLRNVTLTSNVTFSNSVNVTLDLNGKTITGGKNSEGEQAYPVIRVQGGANVTVKNGTITNADYVFVLGASDGSSAGYLTIESGKYHGDTTVASVTKGTLTINGGEFSVDPYEGSYEYLLNCIDPNYNDGSAKIEVKGGTFHNFNPANNAAETGGNTNFVADGYLAEETAEGVYTVRQNKDALLAQVTITFDDSNSGEKVTLKYPSERYDTIQKLIGTNDYADFVLGASQSELLAYIADGRASNIVMTLYDDIVLDTTLYFYDTYFQVVADYEITLNLNGYTISASENLQNAPVIRVLNKGLTVTNGTVDGTTGINSYAFIVGEGDNAGVLNIAGGTYKGVTSVISITNGTANISGGTFSTAHDNEGKDYGAQYLLNCIDPAYEAGNAKFNVTGGTFYGFDPANNTAEGENTNFVADGYKSVDNGDDTWTVEYDYAMDVIVDYTSTWSGSGTFVMTQTDSIAEAIEYVKGYANVVYGFTVNKITLKLNKNAVVSADGTQYTYDCSWPLTIDLNGKTLTGSILAPNATLTVENGSIVNTNKDVSAIEINAGTLDLENVNIDSARHAVRIDGAVTATINGGTYRAAIGEGTGTYHALNVSGAANVTINDGTFVGPNGTTADSGSAVNVQTGATVTIHGGKFSGGKTNTLANAGTLTIDGGLYDQDPNAYVVDTHYGVAYVDETYKFEVVNYVEWVQAQLFAGNDVKLEKDIVITDYDLVHAHKWPSNGNGKYTEEHGNGAIFHIYKPGVELDLNGHSITWNAHHDYYCNKRQVSLFMVTITGNDGETSDFTVTDSSADKTGKVDVYGMGTGMYVVGVNAKGTIAGGTWTNYPCKTCSASNIFLYPSHGGEMCITGGTFEQKESEYLLGWMGSTKETDNNGVGTDYDETKVVISGGTFVGFNPEYVKFFDTANSGQETINGCKEGYYAEETESDIWEIKVIVAHNVQQNKDYADLATALGKAEAGETVKLLKDAEVSVVMVTANVTLDLNGKNVKANYFISFGDVVDGEAGGIGGLNGNYVNIYSENTYLPIYDSENSCYRFFKVDIVSLGSREVDDAVTFGVALRFANVEAYDLIANTQDAKLTLYFSLVVDEKVNAPHLFNYSDAGLKSWAGNAYKYYTDPSKEKDWALTMKISGISSLESGVQLVMTPKIKSEIGVEHIATGIEYTVVTEVSADTE